MIRRVELRLHACDPELSPRLAAELRDELPGGTHRELSAGLLESALPAEDSAREPTLAFARQTLPDCHPLAAASVSAWARATTAALLPRLLARPADAPWRLHVLRVGDPATQPGPRRAALIEAAVLDELKDQRRRLLRSRVANPAAPRTPDEALVQLALATPEAGWFSFAEADVVARLRRVLSRFAGGACEVPEDRRPPARAYRKLLEVEARWPRPLAAGETCVDLGAAPGSWSWIALERGARVTAIDRAPLREDLMQHPSLSFVRGDAFKWLPPAPVDWVLCDVIAEPRRSVELLARWLDARACRRFALTVKFKGDAGDVELRELKALLVAQGVEHVVRHLDANKNEITAYGERGEPGATPRIGC
jgi:23S rRNA (cytidine2498-2'-O)-methyltransferase